MGEALRTLGIGLSRVLRYSYGGFLLIVFASIFETATAKMVREAMSWELAALTAVVVGAGIYAVHRSVVVPVYHAIMCLGWWGVDAVRGIDKAASGNPTRWLGSLGVPLVFRIPAYTVLRRSQLFEQEKTDWDIAHAEAGLVLITAEALAVAALYASWQAAPSIGPRPLAWTALALFVFSYTDFAQHVIERLRFHQKKEEVRTALQESGMLP